MLMAEDDILLVCMERAEILGAFFCFSFNRWSLLPFSMYTTILSEGEAGSNGEQWVRKTLERSGLKSPCNPGTAQDLHTCAVQYNSVAYQL